MALSKVLKVYSNEDVRPILEITFTVHITNKSYNEPYAASSKDNSREVSE